MRKLTGDPITDPAELAKTIAEIVRETGRWNQEFWWNGWFEGDADEVGVIDARNSLNANACGTTACVAGWATILHAPEGSKIDFNDNVVLPNGREIFADRYGREALGLSQDQAEYLFSAVREKAQVLYVLDAIAEGRDWSRAEVPPKTGPCPACGEDDCHFNN